jgi:hypothetical protein
VVVLGREVVSHERGFPVERKHARVRSTTHTVAVQSHCALPFEASVHERDVWLGCGGTLPLRKRNPLGPYSRPMHGLLLCS